MKREENHLQQGREDHGIERLRLADDLGFLCEENKIRGKKKEREGGGRESEVAIEMSIMGQQRDIYAHWMRTRTQ